ncbi:ATP-binding cassette domain-containing protein [Kitasatospora viridis]|uniref:ABC-2 type transport system ATP-binding protein n=1 Tax=Kitasatospora viridis TaxID=281105 RepID=A0A561UDZ5_9ACTN|nr:ATP-binding cassette domain-containing protein [Kitasatospora viridis]TWF97592.1 ABC-2 type transport system ATP-binding protein [Kitasatospora viridis]
MIQVSGLTKVYRRGRRPALFDLGFDVRPGTVTALLGPEGAGKTLALRLMLELERGTGVTLFDGRTYRRLRRPEHEVGVLLPDERSHPGSPGRTARGHLRMLAAAVGVPARHADELLEQTRLAAVADHRLRSFSAGMTRRLGLAAALLGEPSALLLDAPTEGLSPRTVEWLHAFIRAFPAGGGCVLLTTRDPREAALLADQVVTLDRGQQVADQPVSEFRRTRLHREVAVRGPQMARLADLLVAQGAQVRPEGGAGLAVAGLGRTEIGELAYRNGIMLHELADRVVEQPAPRAVRPIQARSGPAPTVQLRRAATITVGERHPVRPALPDPAVESPPTLELPPVTGQPLPDAAPLDLAPACVAPSDAASPDVAPACVAPSDGAPPDGALLDRPVPDEVPPAHTVEEPSAPPGARTTRGGEHPDLPVARTGSPARRAELPPPSALVRVSVDPVHSGATPEDRAPAEHTAAPAAPATPSTPPAPRPSARGSRVAAFLAPATAPAAARPAASTDLADPTGTPATPITPQPLTGPDHWNG